MWWREGDDRCGGEKDDDRWREGDDGGEKVMIDVVERR